MKKVMMLLANGVEPSGFYGDALFVDQAVVSDDNFITSTGPGTALEVALTLLEKLSSKDNAEDLRKIMRIPTPSTTWLQTPQV